MFYSVNINTSDITETLREVDVLKVCANLLREECRTYNFLLNITFCDADDLKLSFDVYKKNRPVSWNEFFCRLPQKPSIPTKKQRVCDSLFQIAHSLINDNSVTPLSVGFAQSVHETC